jgi:hypothetical protein
MAFAAPSHQLKDVPLHSPEPSCEPAVPVSASHVSVAPSATPPKTIKREQAASDFMVRLLIGYPKGTA